MAGLVLLILSWMGPAPEMPFYDWGACPGEFKCYGTPLTMPEETTVYDSYKEGRKAVARLSAGDKITAIRGVVISLRPGVIKMDRDLPERNLSAGDTILTYGFGSEGFSPAWFKDKYYPEFDISFSKWPNGTCSSPHCSATYVDWGVKAWWIETKLGWIEMKIGQPSGI